MADLIRDLSREVKKGIVEGALILCLGSGFLAWSLMSHAASRAGLAASPAFWSSLPVLVLGISYFVRSYADSRVCLKLKAIRQTLPAAPAPHESGEGRPAPVA